MCVYMYIYICIVYAAKESKSTSLRFVAPADSCKFRTCHNSTGRFPGRYQNEMSQEGSWLIRPLSSDTYPGWLGFIGDEILPS